MKQSDSDAPVMLELWRMLITSSLPLLPGPHEPGAVAPDKVLSMGQIELFDIQVVKKVGNCSQGQPEGSLFNSYYTEV